MELLVAITQLFLLDYNKSHCKHIFTFDRLMADSPKFLTISYVNVDLLFCSVQRLQVWSAQIDHQQINHQKIDHQQADHQSIYHRKIEHLVIFLKSPF